MRTNFALCWIVAYLGACASPATDKPEDDTTAPRRDIVGTERNRHSQHGEELVIRDFFQDRTDGVFLDVGAAWPVYYNNTYHLESELGWTGVAVDALPEHGKRWRNRRPNSQFFNYVVTDRSGDVETFYRNTRGDLIGVSTLTPGAGLGRGADFEEIQVPTTTLTDLLDEAGVSRIDLLSMDIEGHELPALAGFDLERFQPELVCVEVHASARLPIIEYFESRGYRRLERYDAYDFANYYFTSWSED